MYHREMMLVFVFLNRYETHVKIDWILSEASFECLSEQFTVVNFLNKTNEMKCKGENNFLF